jgi:hypothetical protein
MFIPIVFFQQVENKHVSYLPAKKTMGINMCHIYLLKKQRENM